MDEEEKEIQANLMTAANSQVGMMSEMELKCMMRAVRAQMR